MRKTLARTCTVLTACLIAVYIASIWWYVLWAGNQGNRLVFLMTAYGSFRIDVYTPPIQLKPTDYGFSLKPCSEISPGPWPWWFTFDSMQFGGGAGGVTSLTTIAIPMWLPLLATALPAFLLSRPRPRPNHCPTCTYDLSATPNLPCPECGTPSVSSVPSA